MFSCSKARMVRWKKRFFWLFLFEESQEKNPCSKDDAFQKKITPGFLKKGSSRRAGFFKQRTMVAPEKNRSLLFWNRTFRRCVSEQEEPQKKNRSGVFLWCCSKQASTHTAFSCFKKIMVLFFFKRRIVRFWNERRANNTWFFLLFLKNPSSENPGFFWNTPSFEQGFFSFLLLKSQKKRTAASFSSFSSNQEEEWFVSFLKPHLSNKNEKNHNKTRGSSFWAGVLKHTVCFRRIRCVSEKNRSACVFRNKQAETQTDNLVHCYIVVNWAEEPLLSKNILLLYVYQEKPIFLGK